MSDPHAAAHVTPAAANTVAQGAISHATSHLDEGLEGILKFAAEMTAVIIGVEFATGQLTWKDFQEWLKKNVPKLAHHKIHQSYKGLIQNRKLGMDQRREFREWMETLTPDQQADMKTNFSTMEPADALFIIGCIANMNCYASMTAFARDMELFRRKRDYHAEKTRKLLKGHGFLALYYALEELPKDTDRRLGIKRNRRWPWFLRWIPWFSGYRKPSGPSLMMRIFR